MSEPALKCENDTLLRKTKLNNCSLVLISGILAISAQGENLDFPDFLQKKCYNIDYRNLKNLQPISTS